MLKLHVYPLLVAPYIWASCAVRGVGQVGWTVPGKGSAAGTLSPGPHSPVDPMVMEVSVVGKGAI